MSAPPHRRIPLDRTDLLRLGALAFVALAARAAFVAASGVPRFDPWRHLALLRALREGSGFTLFDGQPYLWYGPAWYLFCALFPPWIGPQWVAALCSTLGVLAVYLLLRGDDAGETRTAALVGGGLAALGGPWIAYTCHYGPEALALALALISLLALRSARRSVPALIAGVAWGAAVVLRTNVAFMFPLFLPVLRTRSRAAAFVGGGALPLLAAWWRNRSIIREYEFVFTWDGLAAPSDGFNVLSTLIVQLHPDVGAALRRLHEQIIPVPEWIRGPDGIAWHLMLYMACGVAAVSWTRRWPLWLATAGTLGYFLLLDGSMSSNFFRIYLPLFPLFCLALGELAGRAGRSATVGRALALALLLAGLPLLRPANAIPLEVVTPPAELLTEDAYMVNSSFYHPESLIWRYPDKRFIGMPLDPEEFERFRALHPDYRTILWHDISVQDALASYLENSLRYEVVGSGTNAAGRRYTLLRARE